MNKDDILALLQQKGIPFTIQNHKAVYTMAECEDLNLLYPQWDAKNLFLRDDKKKHYYLLTVRGNLRVDLEGFRKAQGLRRIQFASEKDMLAILQLFPGAVTPFGLLNTKKDFAEGKTLTFFLDDYFEGEEAIIGAHPNDNTATVWLKVKDLIRVLEESGYLVQWLHPGEEERQ